jgi:hypothetical protein
MDLPVHGAKLLSIRHQGVHGRFEKNPEKSMHETIHRKETE